MAMRKRNWHWPESAYGPSWSWEEVLAVNVRPGDVLLGREKYGRQNRGVVTSVSSSKINDGTGFTTVTVMFRWRRIGEGFRARDAVRVRSPRVTYGALVDYGWGGLRPPREVK